MCKSTQQRSLIHQHMGFLVIKVSEQPQIILQEVGEKGFSSANLFHRSLTRFTLILNLKQNKKKDWGPDPQSDCGVFVANTAQTAK